MAILRIQRHVEYDMSELPPLPTGFRGLQRDKSLRIYTRHLPHWRQDGATYFATFRLADSLPEAKLIELRNLRAFWEHQHPEPRSEKDWEEFAREYTRRAEAVSRMSESMAVRNQCPRLASRSSAHDLVIAPGRRGLSQTLGLDQKGIHQCVAGGRAFRTSGFRRPPPRRTARRLATEILGTHDRRRG